MPTKKKVLTQKAPEASNVELMKCEPCKGVGVDMSVNDKELCAVCQGTGQVEVK